MNEEIKKDRRRDTILSVIALLAVGLAIYYFYRSYNRTDVQENPAISGVTDTQTGEITSLGDYFENLTLSNRIIRTSTDEMFSETVTGELPQLLNAEYIVQDGTIRRINFEETNTSIINTGTEVYVLDHAQRTYESMPDVSRYQSIITAMEDSNWNIDSAYTSFISGLGFNRVEGNTWESIGSLELETGTTSVPVKLQFNGNETTGLLESMIIMSDNNLISQQVDIGYTDITDEAVQNTITLPAGYTGV